MLWHFMDLPKDLFKKQELELKQLMEQNLTIETKSNANDLVTNVDKATEDFILIQF